MDLPDVLLDNIVLRLDDGRPLRATCRKGRAITNLAVRHIKVRGSAC